MPVWRVISVYPKRNGNQRIGQNWNRGLVALVVKLCQRSRVFQQAFFQTRCHDSCFTRLEPLGDELHATHGVRYDVMTIGRLRLFPFVLHCILQTMIRF